VLLAYREGLHAFARQQLSEPEIRDALMLGIAALVILPLVPDRYIGPYAAINLRTLWKLTVLMMVIGAAGHIAVRLLGPRYGLALSGFASGFVSSTATVGTLGSRTREEPTLLNTACLGATLSSVATPIQLVLLLTTVCPAMLTTVLLPLACGGLALLAYAGIFLRGAHNTVVDLKTDEGSAFSLRLALLLALGLSAISLLSSVLLTWLGHKGLIIAATLGGFADAHSSAMSIASLVQAEKLGKQDAVWPVLCALSSNSLAKCFVAQSSGGAVYGRRVAGGLLLMLATAWSVAALGIVL
jgi:uncharacterized membrane protein (DUF4010 family)